MASAEAALSSCKEGHIIQAGNPTHRSGPLFRAATTARKQWHVISINGDPDDPKRSPRVSVQWAREFIEEHGRNNAFVLVNVFGQFPEADFNALISEEEVANAMKLSYREYEIGNAPRILGVDVARYGDDASAIAFRRGIQGFKTIKYRDLDSTQGAGQVARQWAEFNANAVFIDATGGFGAGWIDQLRQLGRGPIGVQFAGKAHDTMAFANKRAEMTYEFVQWIKRGGALYPSKELKDSLVATNYTFQKGRMIVEPKEIIKMKLGYSPDEMDAMMMTFAEPVTVAVARNLPSRHRVEYDPFAAMDKPANHSYEYDAFRS
jgi:hypothetical protein